MLQRNNIRKQSHNPHYEASIYLATCLCTGAHIPLLRNDGWHDIKIENVDRQAHRRAGIWYIDNTGEVTLDWSTRQKEVNLVVVVS